MTQWWEIDIPQPPGEEPRLRAVAYYRHSAQDRQENSIPIQQEQVREWAQKNGVEISRSQMIEAIQQRRRLVSRFHGPPPVGRTGSCRGCKALFSLLASGFGCCWGGCGENGTQQPQRSVSPTRRREAIHRLRTAALHVIGVARIALLDPKQRLWLPGG